MSGRNEGSWVKVVFMGIESVVDFYGGVTVFAILRGGGGGGGDGGILRFSIIISI